MASMLYLVSVIISCLTLRLTVGLTILLYAAGRVVDGLLVLRKIENVPTGPNNKPKVPILISQCGEM